MVVDENSEWLGVPRILLMENAGANIARAVHSWIGTLRGVDVVVFCGPGNNGGDGMVAARHMASVGAKTTVILLGSPDKIRTNEARMNLEALKSMKESINLVVIEDADELHKLKPLIEKAEAIIDAIFGTGIKGKIREPYRTAIQIINSSKAFKLSVDIPSGVNPDTGEIEDIAVKADMTVTFHRLKKGIITSTEYCGEVVVASIGIPPEAEFLMGPGDLQDALIDFSQESKPIGLIDPDVEISQILSKLGVEFYLSNTLDKPVIYVSREVVGKTAISSVNLVLSEGLRKESTICIIKEDVPSSESLSEKFKRVRDLAIDNGKIIYLQSNVDVVSDGEKCKASWFSRPLGRVGSAALRAMILYLLSHNVDPFKACCAAGYVAGYVEENGLEKLSTELNYRKSRVGL